MFSVAQLCTCVHELALQHFDDSIVSASCVALLTLLRGDVTHLQNHLRVANLLLSREALPKHCSLEERATQHKRVVADIGSST